MSLRPDIVITQATPGALFVSNQEVQELLSELGSEVEHICLEPVSIAGMLSDVQRVSEVLNRERQGRDVLRDSVAHLHDLKNQLKGVVRPQVLALEWFDPPYAVGSWVLEQIENAGGVPVVGKAGEPGEQLTWSRIHELDPDVLLLMPCGKTAREAIALLSELEEPAPWEGLRAVNEQRVWALDSKALFCCPGPRLVQGAEALGHVLHPERVPRPTGVPPAIRLGRQSSAPPPGSG